ncbi:hypothetical protein D9M72_615390 [compost metagenome]
MTAGETQFIELEHRQVSLFAHRQLADIGTTQQARRTLGRPAQHALRGDLLGAVAQALDVQGLARFEHHVRGIVGGRTVHAQTQQGAGVSQFDARADA